MYAGVLSGERRRKTSRALDLGKDYQETAIEGIICRCLTSSYITLVLICPHTLYIPRMVAMDNVY